MNDFIKIQDLSKSYGKKKVIDHLSLTINQGMFGLLGPNGAGKTTLMRILTTITSFDEGSVNICDVDIKKASEIRSMIGYLPQDFSIYPNMSVYEVMEYLGVLSGMPKAKRKDVISNLLEEVNLTKQRNKKVKQLSGGMRQRLGIAQAIMNNPRVLIIDEPTAGLDPEERVRFRNLLCDIASDRIVILSTHIVGDIEATCEKIAVMDAGEILYQGQTEEFIQQVTGKVFTLDIPSHEVGSLKERFIVTSVIKKGSTTNCRIIATREIPPGAVEVSPNVEDAYMYIMHQKREV